MKYRIIIALVFIVFTVSVSYIALQNVKTNTQSSNITQTLNQKIETTKKSNPLMIEVMRESDYPGSDIVIEEELAPGSNYKRYLTSYKSDGLKIFALLTVPTGTQPLEGWPAIVFNHGYIPPEQYTTTERYVAYVDGLAREGYVVFKIDYRGHGESEGTPSGAYYAPGYTSDVLNASSSLKKLNYVNRDKIGAWGHSMAGTILTRAMAVKPDEYKAVVIWGGVVGSHEDIYREWWSKRRPGPTFTPSQREMNANRPSRQSFISQYGEPDDDNEFWKSISPTTYLSEINVPIQLDHGTLDETVPVELSIQYADRLKNAGKTVELFTYPGSNHDIEQGFTLAMQRTVDFFDKYLK